MHGSEQKVRCNCEQRSPHRKTRVDPMLPLPRLSSRYGAAHSDGPANNVPGERGTTDHGKRKATFNLTSEGLQRIEAILPAVSARVAGIGGA
jgi:hypothetical protein